MSRPLAFASRWHLRGALARPAAVLTLALLVAGCHDFARLSSSYGVDFGCPGCSDLAPAAARDLLSPAGDLPLPSADLVPPSGAADLAPPVVGHLTGSGGATLAAIDLTADGPVDWAHFGYPDSGDMDYKASAARVISYYTTLSGNTATVFTNNTVSFSWSDGTLTPMLAAGTTTGMYRTGVADGFAVTVPASTQPHTVAVYVGGYRSNGKLTASLSDSSAPDYSDASFSRSDTQLYNVTYTLTFNAAHDGQTLQIKWAAASVIDDGNVTLQAVSLR